MARYFSLYDLLVKNEIKGLIFDKFEQRDQMRLFPYKQKLFGSFEAYVYEIVDVRHRSKKFEYLELTAEDKKVILYAFLHRESLGQPDGMGDISNPMFDVGRFSPGTREDNYIFDSELLLELYDTIDNLANEKIPLPLNLRRILSRSMSFCYFDKSPIDDKGSICELCAEELRKEGYEVPESFIAKIKVKEIS